MRDRPDLTQLLDAAREALLQEVLAAVPARLRHEVLMIASALAIAARTAAAGDAPLQNELAALHALYALGAAPSLCGAELEAQLLGLNRRLASDIRNGRYDAQGDERDAVRRLLEGCVKDKLRESKPKFLSQHDEGGYTAAERESRASAQRAQR